MDIILRLVNKKTDLLGQYHMDLIDERFGAELFDHEQSVATGSAWLRSEGADLRFTLEIREEGPPVPDHSGVCLTTTVPKEQWVAKSPGLTARGFLDDGTQIKLDLEIEKQEDKVNLSIVHALVVDLEARIATNPGYPEAYCRVWAYCPPRLDNLSLSSETTYLGAYRERKSTDGDAIFSGMLAEWPRKNRFPLEVEGIRYRCLSANDVTLVDLAPCSEERFPTPQALNSFLTGLSFLHGEDFRACGYCLKTAAIEICRVTPQAIGVPFRKTPLPDFRYLFEAPDQWDDCWPRLLRSWLSYTGSLDVYAYIRPILHSASAPFDVQSLVLTAMIEGLSRKILEAQPSPLSEELRLAVAAVKGFLDRWRRSKVMPRRLCNKVYERICGLLGMLKRTSGPDAIKAACEALGTSVSSDELKAWGNLRHVRAHGSVTTRLDPEEVRLYNLALTLFFRMCLKQIGYCGKQTLHHDGTIAVI